MHFADTYITLLPMAVAKAAACVCSKTRKGMSIKLVVTLVVVVKLGVKVVLKVVVKELVKSYKYSVPHNRCLCLYADACIAVCGHIHSSMRTHV